MNDERPDPWGEPRGARPALKGNILIVDPDEFLVEMIGVGLTLSRPGWGIIAARQPSEALEILSRHSELDAIITEIDFDLSPISGKAFVREVDHRWHDIPVFVMSYLDPEETHSLDSAEVIAKPPDIDFLVSRVDRAIRKKRESRVRGISLPTFLQILEIEQKTCTVIVSHGGHVGEVYLRKGTLMQARFDGMDGAEALFGMLSMREHSLRVIDKCDVERKITASLASLLMDWSVREDHAKRDRPPLREENE